MIPTIGKEWERLEHDMRTKNPRPIPDWQLAQMKELFYAGAVACLHIVKKAVVESTQPSEASASIMALSEELQTWKATLRNKVGKG